MTKPMSCDKINIRYALHLYNFYAYSKCFDNEKEAEYEQNDSRADRARFYTFYIRPQWRTIMEVTLFIYYF